MVIYLLYFHITKKKKKKLHLPQFLLYQHVFFSSFFFLPFTIGAPQSTDAPLSTRKTGKNVVYQKVTRKRK